MFITEDEVDPLTKEEIYDCLKRVFEEGDALLGKVFLGMIRYEVLYHGAEKENEQLRKANNL